jgi:hypothetical protein
MIGNAVASIFAPPFSAPIVTGGTLFTSGGFNYRVFTGNGTLGVSGSTLTADILVIAGGGGADNGGGGAGGLLYTASQSLTVNSFTVTIGAGGGSGGSASNGIDSSLIGGAVSLTATGGGKGAGSGVGSSRAPLLSSLSDHVTVQAQQPVKSSSPLLGIAFQGRIKPVADLLGDQFELRGFKNYVSVNVDSLPTVATTSHVETKVSDEDEDNAQDIEGPLTSSEIMRQLERERASRL